MRVLVTGGAGFIGSTLVRHLILDKGYEVLALDKLTYAGSRDKLSPVEHCPNFRFLQADTCDAHELQEAFLSFRPDRVMHLAAESHVDRSISGPAGFVRTNVMGTLTLLEVARAHYADLRTEAKQRFRLLHVSTDEVFGSLGAEGSFSETSPYAPRSPYSASKAASDHLVRAWAHTYGLPVLVSHCSNNYGPFQHPEKLVPMVILRALEGGPIPVYGTGENVRDWLYVEDHVRALVTIVERGRIGETYNVGGGSERRNIEVARHLCALLDRRLPFPSHPDRLIRFVADRPGHDARYAVDATKLQNELGWRAVESFETGMEKTVDWYLEHRERRGTAARPTGPHSTAGTQAEVA